jgi:hypothetical protein
MAEAAYRVWGQASGPPPRDRLPRPGPISRRRGALPARPRRCVGLAATTATPRACVSPAVTAVRAPPFACSTRNILDAEITYKSAGNSTVVDKVDMIIEASELSTLVDSSFNKNGITVTVLGSCHSVLEYLSFGCLGAGCSLGKGCKKHDADGTGNKLRLRTKMRQPAGEGDEEEEKEGDGFYVTATFNRDSSIAIMRTIFKNKSEQDIVDMVPSASVVNDDADSNTGSDMPSLEVPGSESDGDSDHDGDEDEDDGARTENKPQP